MDTESAAAAPSAESADSAVPLPPAALVTVLAGNPVTSAAVLACLNTVDASALRRLYPAVAAVVADVPWSDMDTPVADVVQWRAALPAAVGARVARLSAPAAEDALARIATALVGIVRLDLSECKELTDAMLARLPPSLCELNVEGCWELTYAASLVHLTALATLRCSRTKLWLSNVGCLPSSLQELIADCLDDYDDDVDLSHLTSLRELACTRDSAVICGLPPSLQSLYVGHTDERLSLCSLAHLLQLQTVDARGSRMDDGDVASLPPCLKTLGLAHCLYITPAVSFLHLPALQHLDVDGCRLGDECFATLPPSLVSLQARECAGLTPAATLPHLPALRRLDLAGTGIGDAMVASLPAGLAELRIAHCQHVTRDARLDHLPALQVLDASDTAIDDAVVTSLPAGLTELHIVRCRHVTRDATLDHLPALRRLQSFGTDLAPAVLEACRVRGCTVPVFSLLHRGKPSLHFLALLPDGRLAGIFGQRGVRVWDFVDGREAAAVVCEIGGSDAHSDAHANALAALLDGSGGLAVGTREWHKHAPGGAIEVWDLDCAPPTRRSAFSCDSGVAALAGLHGGRLAAGCVDGRIRIADVGTAAVVAVLEAHGYMCSVLALLPDGSLASGSYGGDGMLRVWDVDACACVATMSGRAEFVHALAVLADGRLATGAQSSMLLWDVGTRSCVGVSTGCTHLAALPDGRLVGGDDSLLLWDTRAAAAAASSRAVTAQPQPVQVAESLPALRQLLPLPDGRVVCVFDDEVHLFTLPY